MTVRYKYVMYNFIPNVSNSFNEAASTNSMSRHRLASTAYCFKLQIFIHSRFLFSYCTCF